MRLSCKRSLAYALTIVLTICGGSMLFLYFRPVTYTSERWVLFDFDGTIANSTQVVLLGINELQSRYGYDTVSAAEVEGLRAYTMQDLLKKRLGIKWYQLPFFQRRWIRAVKKHLAGIPVHDGMAEVLATLQTNGYKIGIISSNSADFIAAFFSRHGLPRFDAISEASIFGKASTMRRFMRKYGIAAAHAVYIGDETRDIEAAHKVGIPCFAVTWGGNNAQLLQTYQPEALVHRANELLTTITTHFYC